jgi:hypothetical protein
LREATSAISESAKKPLQTDSRMTSAMSVSIAAGYFGVAWGRSVRDARTCRSGACKAGEGGAAAPAVRPTGQLL